MGFLIFFRDRSNRWRLDCPVGLGLELYIEMTEYHD
jgi:hypothetical protein